MDALTTLPGVGRKTANVVLGHALGVPGLPVDRHVLRVANRIGLVKSENPEDVEARLCKIFPSDGWTRVSDTLILHGRRICRPHPLCDRCSVRDLCDYYRKIRSQKTEVRSRKTEVGRQKLGARRRNSEAGSRNPSVRVRKMKKR
jgi:endonuclease-3